jgi:hypothetical protein
MSLDCEACDALLIDLVERELDETRAAEVRAHAATCESCGRSLARLEGGRRAARELLRAEPPRLDAVMAAARARAAEVRAAAHVEQVRSESVPTPPVVAPPEPSDKTWLDAVWRWLGSWATGPQVAMAALLVLMVGIGLFNLPQFRSHEGTGADGALVEPDVHAEMGSALDPAAPLDLDVDPRTQHVTLGGEQAGALGDPTHDVRPTTTLAQTETDHATERTAERPPVVHETAAADTAEASDRIDELALAEIPASDGVGRVEDGPLPDVPGGAEAQTGIVMPSQRPSTTPMAVRPPATRSGSTYDDMVAPPSTSPAGIMPAAIHHQARALASAGHCDEAVPRYRSLLAEHPDYADAPRAMIELAECDRRLGRLDDADRWLTRAETFPSVSADARRERVRVSAERRAVDRPAPSVDTSRGATSAPPDTASSY